MNNFRTRAIFIRLLALCALALGSSPCLAQEVDAFESVRAYMQEAVNQGKVAGGAVIVYHGGKIVLETGFGFADVATKRPFKITTPALIASVSKPIMATAFYRLVDAGKLDLTIPITAYLPEFNDRKLETGVAITRAPTVTELITHTSGLRSDYAKYGRIWFQDWTRNQSLAYVVAEVAKDFSFVTEPGTSYAYSGIGTDVAARVSEVVSGEPRNQMLQTWVCEPLGMAHTFYRDAGGLKRQKTEMPTRYFIGKETGKLRVTTRRRIPNTNGYSSSGGTIISTAPDLLNWLLLLRNNGTHAGKQLLTEQSHNRMFRPNKVSDAAMGGLFIRAKGEDGKPVRFGHTGSSGTNIWIDFQTDTIGIMLTQTKGTDIKPFRIELERRITEVVSQLE
jgi:CubicO group peptidase (beta-lactamase class C family)